MDKKLVFAIILSAILAIALVLAIVRPEINIPDIGEAQQVSTTGSYTVKESPDFATILIGFESSGNTAEEAQQKNSDQMYDITLALKRKGLTEDDLKTANYYVGPQYNWERGNREIVGYRATHTLEVTVEDYRYVGKYLDAAVSAGATQTYSVRFELDEAHQSELKKEALTKATQDARDKADAMAEGLGKRVIKAVSVSDNMWDYGPVYAMEAKAGAEIAMANIEPYHEPTQIQVGDVEVSARVNAVFEIA